MSSAPLKSELLRDGRLLRLTLARPKANIVDAEMIAYLQAALDEHIAAPRLLALLIDAEGPHFSFGASVEEHLPERCADMLAALHRLVLTLVESPLPVLAAVRGMCLGGGLELALGAHRIFASPDAGFGQPEIKLGVFAPAASCLLPLRVGRAAADDLLFSGRTAGADEAVRIGLADSLADDPLAAALDYFDAHLAPLSAFTLRHAVGAARGGFARGVRDDIARVERRYLDELMAGRDPLEGLSAFIEKRTPTWEHR